MLQGGAKEKVSQGSMLAKTVCHHKEGANVDKALAEVNRVSLATVQVSNKPLAHVPG